MTEPEQKLQDESSSDGDIPGDIVPLVERAVSDNNLIDMKIIAPGWGSSGYYSEEVLREDGPKAWPVGTHMYLDHPTESESRERPERSIRDLAAVVVTTPEFKPDGEAGPGLYAKSSVLPPYKDVIEALAPHIGVSIRAHGSFKSGEAEGRKGRIITKIDRGESVDFVTKPGAGGKVLALMESLRQKQDDDVSESQKANDEDAPASEAAKEDEGMELSEATERITALEGELEESQKATQEATLRAERAEGALAILEARKFVAGLLENVELPSAAKKRIEQVATVDPLMKDGKIDKDAIKEAVESLQKLEAEYIEQITESGKVTDQGASTAPAKDESKITESLASGMGRFFGLSEDAAKRAAEGR